MDGFSIAAKAVIPFVVYIGFGMGVRRTGLVDEPFLRKLNSVIFYCFYPIVSFCNIYGAGGDGIRLQFLALVAASVLVCIGLCMLAVPRFIKAPAQQGVVVQALYRSNILLFALPLGLVVAFGSMSRCKPLSGAVKTFVWVIRGTPLMLQIIVIYLGPGLLGMNNPWPSGSGGRMVAAVVAFAINYACYFSEIYRGGIEAVPKGQTEAGQVLGMTKTQIFFKVTLLQVVKRILAPMGNEVITLVKDTSLANTIANKEIIMMAKEYSAKGLIWPLFSTAIFFLVFVGALTLLFGWAEKKLDYFR